MSSCRVISSFVATTVHLPVRRRDPMASPGARPPDPSRRGAARRRSEPDVPAGSRAAACEWSAPPHRPTGEGGTNPCRSSGRVRTPTTVPILRSAARPAASPACLRATSACSTRSARSGPRRGRSRSNASSSVVIPNGGLATTRYGSFGSVSRRTSVSITRTPSSDPTGSQVGRAGERPTPDRVRPPTRGRRPRRSGASARPCRHPPRRRVHPVRVRASRRTA